MRRLKLVERAVSLLLHAWRWHHPGEFLKIEVDHRGVRMGRTLDRGRPR